MYNSKSKALPPFANDKRPNSFLIQDKEIDQTNSITSFGTMAMPNLHQKTDSFSFGAPNSKPAPISSAIKFPNFEPSLYSTQYKPVNTTSFSAFANPNASSADFNFDYNVPFSTNQHTSNITTTSSLLPLSNPTIVSSLLPSANPLLAPTQKHTFIGDTTQSKLNPINLNQPIADTYPDFNKSSRLLIEIQEQRHEILQINKKVDSLFESVEDVYKINVDMAQLNEKLKYELSLTQHELAVVKQEIISVKQEISKISQSTSTIQTDLALIRDDLKEKSLQLKLERQDSNMKLLLATSSVLFIASVIILINRKNI